MMMSLRRAVFGLAGLAFVAAGAMAQNVPPPGEGPGPGPGPGSKPISATDMAKHHAEMCLGRLAHESGRLTSLEIELNLTDKQKPAFEKWKAVKLTAAKADADRCRTTLPPPPPKDGAKPRGPSPVEAFKKDIRHLQDRLAAMKAEEPVLEAFVATLSEEQIGVLAPVHGGPNEGPHSGVPHGGAHAGPHSGQEPGPGPQDEPPPPHT